jgi:PAS domain S-box-containing protein
MLENGAGVPDALGHVQTPRDERQFRRFLDTLPTAAYTCDPDGLITYYNPQAVQLWGRAPKLSDPVDRFCGSFKLFAADGTPIAHEQCWMALALRTDSEYNGHEIVIERPDGSHVTALAHANPVRDESGRLLGGVNVLVDISDRKRAEDALKEADRSKNEFLATLAHELRNPLAPIRNALHLMSLKGGPPPEQQWALDVIERQMQQMTRLIDDLLDIARITVNKLELRQERIEVGEVLNAAVATSRPLIETAGHELAISAPGEPLFLDGDLTRLAQVVSNLLNNAAKYTERGGCIRLAVERQGSDVVISVRDTGIGIPAEALPRIFEMFTQVDRSMERSQGGLGIGLTLVKRLVDLHGGSITAQSDGAGKGSEFTVRLPLAMAAPDASPAPRPSEVATGSALRVLVVDDNWDSAATLGMLLRIVGHDVRTAHDGLEALRVAGEFRPAVVLLDIGLPKLNGYETARRLRKEPWGSRVILIATTGWGQAADRERSKDAGFDHHLVKPVDPTALIQLLASLKQTAAA